MTYVLRNSITRLKFSSMRIIKLCYFLFGTVDCCLQGRSFKEDLLPYWWNGFEYLLYSSFARFSVTQIEYSTQKRSVEDVLK